MTRKSFLSIALGCLCVVPLLRQTSLAQAVASGAVAQQTPRKTYLPGDFYLETSRVYVFVGKTGLGHEHAVVGGIKSGRLLLGAADKGGQIVFDMKSFVADTDAARKHLKLEGESSESTRKQVTDNMLGAKVLDAANYPTATFLVKSALPYEKSKRGLPQYVLNGEFTLHSVTRPLTFPVEVEMVKGWQHVRGSFSIKQTDFGITPFSKAFGAIGVADQLTIWGDAWVAPAAPAAP